MKLTKGKISKLYNKKRQSLKKNNNKRKSSTKNKTFRKKRNIHLARKSLKRFQYNKQRGGEDDDKNSQENISKIESKETPTLTEGEQSIDPTSTIINDSKDEITPIVKQLETPIETSLETPIETSLETPIETPIETPSEPPFNTQNGFESINQIAETIATTGGRKIKTRKFRLTNKKKTIHNR